MKYLSLLRELVFCHATPGDERAVADLLKREWTACGWSVESLGHYAVVARSPEWDDARPTVMYCAHMDSPGFIIQSVQEDGSGWTAKLGHPSSAQKPAAAAIKTRHGIIRGTVYTNVLFSDDGTPSENTVEAEPRQQLSRGDRVCYAPNYSKRAGLIHANALDNRVGCWALAVLPRLLGATARVCNVVLAGTAQEEMTGFGANVLAARVPADLTICLDATYTSAEQHITLGGGVVLTVSDKSTLQSPELCAALEQLCAGWNIPLQEEYYDYSGTDARAFPVAGAPQPVLAVLVPSEGNHSPRETIAEADLEALMTLLSRLCTDASALPALTQAWNF